jgi:hypothetical protein
MTAKNGNQTASSVSLSANFQGTPNTKPNKIKYLIIIDAFVNPLIYFQIKNLYT